jgi:hypothetical protein
VPGRPSGKSGFNEDNAFGNVEGKMKNGARRETELGLTAFVYKFEVCHYAFGEGESIS